MGVTRRSAAFVVAALLTLGACGGGDSGPVVKLDGSPRKPDAEGVVLQASVEGISLDGNREYSVSKKLISFSTYNREPVQIASTVGSYVHLGLKGDEVVWLAKVGVVKSDDKGARTVLYQGDLVKIDGSKMTFADGTVLTLADGLTAPEDALGPTYAVIDPELRRVQGATFAPPTLTSTTNARN